MSSAERSPGIVLRTYPLSETSLIVRWLTPDFGRIDTAAKGARRPKSPFRGKLDLFYEADFSFARSRRSELHTLREVTLRETHPALREDMGRLQQASYCVALVEQTTEKETPLPEVFTLLRAFLLHIAVRAPRPRAVFAFELKLLREQGLQPDLTAGRLSPEAAGLVRDLTQSDCGQLDCLQASAASAAEIRQFLHGFLIYHLGKIPAGRAPAVSLES
jgi:DNA repair protein RecO (recombination protein O)